MTNQQTKERIAKEAEKLYVPCGGCGAETPKDRCLGCFHSFGQLAVDDYQLCPKCDAEGVVSTEGTQTSTTRICPVCNGSKLLIRPEIKSV